MLAIIIHLERAVCRSNNVRKLKAKLLNLGFEQVIVMGAVDGETLDGSEICKTLKKKDVLPAYPFDLLRGEIGCYISHLNAWDALIDSGYSQALILEDDADVDVSYLQSALDLCRGSTGYFQLPPRVPRRWSGSHEVPKVERRGLVGLQTTAQVVDRATAQQLKKHAMGIDRPIDCYIQLIWFHNQPIYTVYPNGVHVSSDFTVNSTIQLRRNKSWLLEIFRSFRRLSYRHSVFRHSQRYMEKIKSRGDGWL